MSMQVTCPHCGARYQFDKALIPPGGYDAQCANCSGIFPVAPTAVGEEMPIALPSMSMVDTWLTAPPIAPKQRAKETPPTAQNVAISAVEPVAPQQPVSPPVQAAEPAGAPHMPAAVGQLDYTIACPQCVTVYSVSVEDIPIGGLNATCPKCSTQYRLTSVGVLSVPADMLAPLPTILLEDRVTIDAPRGAFSQLADSVRSRPGEPAEADFSGVNPGREEPAFAGVPSLPTAPSFESTPSYPSAPSYASTPSYESGPSAASFDSAQGSPSAPAFDSTPSYDSTPTFDSSQLAGNQSSFESAPSWESTPNAPAYAAAPAFDSTASAASPTAPSWNERTPERGARAAAQPGPTPAWTGEAAAAFAPTSDPAPATEQSSAFTSTPASAPAQHSAAQPSSWSSAGVPNAISSPASQGGPSWRPPALASGPAVDPASSSGVSGWGSATPVIPNAQGPRTSPGSTAPAFQSQAPARPAALEFNVPGFGKSPVREVTHARETPFGEPQRPQAASPRPATPSVPAGAEPKVEPAAPESWASAPLEEHEPTVPPAWNAPALADEPAGSWGPAPGLSSRDVANTPSLPGGAPPAWNGPGSEPALPPVLPQPKAASPAPGDFDQQVTTEHHYALEAARGLDQPGSLPAMADPRATTPLDRNDFSDENNIPALQNVRVPAATNERSRHGAANWSSTELPPGVKMRAKDAKRKRRPPFDDDDAASWRGGANPQISARDYDDTDEFIRRGVRSPAKRFAITLLLVIAVAAALWFGIPWVRSGALHEMLGIQHSENARVVELVAQARASMLDDTDAGYKAAADTANEALDIDPASASARIAYGLATAFRGADVRGAAQDLEAQGEVVQSSQMLLTASTELAHARRVLSRRNDNASDLAFAAGLYYALDGKWDSARELYVKGMNKVALPPTGEPPTAYAALLNALLQRNGLDVAGTRKALERALALEPTWQRPRFELARELAAHNDPNGARRVLSEILAAVPKHTKAKTMLGQVDEVVNAPTGIPAAAQPGAPQPGTAEPAKPEVAPAQDAASQAPAAPNAPTQPAGPAQGKGPDARKRLEQLRNEFAPEPEIAPSPPAATPKPEAPAAPEGTGEPN